jgi:ABC-2 type transport system permease protein
MTAPAQVVRGVYGLWVREIIAYKREYSRIVSMLFSPIIWLVFLGTGLSSSIDEEAFHGFEYLDVMFPGVIVMSVLFATFFYGMYIVWDRKMDVLKAVLVSPQPRWGLFFGKVLGGATQGITQGALILVLGWPLIRFDVAAVPMVLFYVTLLSVALTALGLAMGSFFDSFEGFQITSTFVVFPMLFLSGAFYPTDQLPGWLDVAVRLNPLTYGVEAIRGLLTDPVFVVYGYVADMAVLVGFTAVAVVVGALSFNRMK